MLHSESYSLPLQSSFACVWLHKVNADKAFTCGSYLTSEQSALTLLYCMLQCALLPGYPLAMPRWARVFFNPSVRTSQRTLSTPHLSLSLSLSLARARARSHIPCLEEMMCHQQQTGVESLVSTNSPWLGSLGKPAWEPVSRTSFTSGCATR
jgi:hypothetical protein